MIKVMSAVEEDSLTGVSSASRIKLLKANFEQNKSKSQDNVGRISPSCSPRMPKSEANGIPKTNAKEVSSKGVPAAQPGPKPSPKPVSKFSHGKDEAESFERRPRYDTAPESEINDHVGKLVTLSLKETQLSKASSDSVLNHTPPRPSPRPRPGPPRKANSEDSGSSNFSLKNATQELPQSSLPSKPERPSRPERLSNRTSIRGPKPPVPKKLTKLDRPQKSEQSTVVQDSHVEEEQEKSPLPRDNWKHKSGPPNRLLPAGPGSLDINANKPILPARGRISPVETKALPPGVAAKQTSQNEGSCVRETSQRRPAPAPRQSPSQKRETRPPPVPKSTRPTMSAAEEQSLYSYAFEPNVKLPMPEKRLLKPEIDSESEDSDYEEPNAKAVQGMMESLDLKSKALASGDVYESPGIASPTEEYQKPDEAAVKGFMESLQSRKNRIESASDQEDYALPDEKVIPPPPVKKQDMAIIRRQEALAQQSDDSSSDEDDPTYIDPNNLSDAQRLSLRRASAGVLSPDAYLPLEMHEDSDYVDPENLPTIPSHLKGRAAEPSMQSIPDEEDSDDDDEPLYQEYAANLVENQRRMSVSEHSGGDSIPEDEEYSRGSLQRTLWSELDTVRMSGVLENLSPEERKRQEAMFEVITSEASYLRSMHILCSHFLAAPEFGLPGAVSVGEVVLDKQQSHFLFSGISAVTKVSESLLAELRTRQEENIMISTISDIIERYATKHFDCYVKYCSNQIFQDRTLNALTANNPRFTEVLGRLECSPKAKSLSMQSFLMLPMQRITRMPLLIDAICHRCEAGSAEFEATERALRAVNKVVKNCNEGARTLERTEEMYFLQCMLTFKTKPIPLISARRWLLRRGEVTCIREETKGPKTMKTKSPLWKRLKGKTKELYLFLFTDLLLVTKMKGEDNFKVIDHCSRGLLKVENIQSQTPETLKPGSHDVTSKYLFSLILLENNKGKTVDYICMVETETDKLRWLDAFTPAKQGEAEGETIYEEWDCPQVQAIHSYQATQPDEITLQEGDVVKVLRKLSDGWYEGLRLRDGEQGWFPANHTEEIISEHVRARNLLQRYRLLTASDAFVTTLLKK